MDSSPSSNRWRAAIPGLFSRASLLPALGFLLYALLLARHMGACAGGSDSSGYLNNARLLAHGHVAIPQRLMPGLPPDALPSYTLVPLGFIPNADRVTMTPTYPVGLSVLVMAASGLVGWHLGPGLVMGVQALLGLWLVYRLAHAAGLETGWAWLAALLLAVSPLYLFMSLHLMSDMPALVWVTAAVLCAWESRARPRLALAAGAALAVAVLVRPSNVLAGVAVALALGFAVRRWLLLIAGGLPGAVFWAFYNKAAYGKFFATGYVGLLSEFGRVYAPGTLLHYAIWLPVLLTPLVLLSLGLPFLWRRQPVWTPLLGAWALVFLVPYLFYSHTHEAWWYLRFLLPAFPPLIVAALLVTRALLVRFRPSFRVWWLAIAGVSIVVYGQGWSHRLYAWSSGRGEKVYPEAAAWMQERLPANAVVATMQTSGALLYYTGFTFFRWDMIGPDEFQRIATACATAGRPLYAALFPFEVKDPPWQAFGGHLTGHWTQIGAVRDVSLWRYDPAVASP
jgi:hypothetical protein